MLFTDGISDARNRADARLGEEPVLEAVARHRHELPSRIAERVLQVLQAHAGDVARRDDVTLVIARA